MMQVPDAIKNRLIQQVQNLCAETGLSYYEQLWLLAKYLQDKNLLNDLPSPVDIAKTPDLRENRKQVLCDRLGKSLETKFLVNDDIYNLIDDIVNSRKKFKQYLHDAVKESSEVDIPQLLEHFATESNRWADTTSLLNNLGDESSVREELSKYPRFHTHPEFYVPLENRLERKDDFLNQFFVATPKDEKAKQKLITTLGKARKVLDYPYYSIYADLSGPSQETNEYEKQQLELSPHLGNYVLGDTPLFLTPWMRENTTGKIKFQTLDDLNAFRQAYIDYQLSGDLKNRWNPKAIQQLNVIEALQALKGIKKGTRSEKLPPELLQYISKFHH
jgi:ribosomal protein S15P/S13E